MRRERYNVRLRSNMAVSMSCLLITSDGFSGVNQVIGSVIHFRPQLPNGVTFIIILGQHVSPIFHRFEGSDS